MKKTLLALALAGACVGAQAAQVEVYGLIDTSLVFVHSDADIAGVADSNKFTMENAQQFGSRFGLRGSEDLGNGMKLSFVLESGFESDTGALDQKQGGRLFGRESQVTLSGDFGALSIGMMPIFGSTLGANGLFRAIDPVTANYTSAFGSGYATASKWTRVDNALSYKTPTFGGFTAYAMYSLKSDSVNGAGDEGKSSAERYASVAARYVGGPVEVVFVADNTNYGNGTALGQTYEKDGWTYTLGGNYTLTNGLKFLTFAQYFNNAQLNTQARAGVALKGITEIAGDYGFVTGWGGSFGVNMPVGNGVAKASVQYRDMNNNDAAEFKRLTLATGYDYRLSKRTTIYAMGGWTQEKVEKLSAEATPNGYQVTAGLITNF